MERDHPEIIGLGPYGGVGGAGRLCAQRLIEAATGQAHRARRTVARGRDACRVVGTSNRSRASVDARAASGLFQTRSRIPLIERGDQRVELTGRDQSLVRAAEHAIGLVRRRRKDECRDREISCRAAREIRSSLAGSARISIRLVRVAIRPMYGTCTARSSTLCHVAQRDSPATNRRKPVRVDFGWLHFDKSLHAVSSRSRARQRASTKAPQLGHSSALIEQRANACSVGG